MAEPFKLRYVNPLVGVFVLGALALALAGIAAAGRSRHWFEGSVVLRARFPVEALETLSAGAPVVLSQERVGEVLELGPAPDGARARLRLDQSARDALRADARAVLRIPLGGLLGQPTVELRRGYAEQPFPDGAELPGTGGAELTRDVDRLVQHVDQLVVRLGPTLERVDGLLAQLESGGAGREASALLRETAGLARGAREHRLLGEAAAAVGELRAVVSGLRSGQGSAGKLLTDETLHARLTAAVERADGALAGIARLSATASEVAQDLGAITSRARSRADDLELLLARTETLVLRANQALDSIQRHWLLGGASAPDDAVPAPPAVLDRGTGASPVRRPGPKAAWTALLLAASACRSTPRPPAPVERALRDRRAGDEARAGGTPAAAASLYARAAAEARATDRRDLAADAEYRLGLARLSAGKAAEAARILQGAAEEAHRAGAPRLAARAYLALARARQDLGEPGVEPSLRLALEQGEAAGDPVARALARIGLAASADPAEAQALLGEAAVLAGGDPAVRCPLALQRARRAERDGAAAGGLFGAAAGQCAGQEDFGALYLALAGAARAAEAGEGPEATLEAADLHRRAAAAAAEAGWRPAAEASLRAAAAALRRGGQEGAAAELERSLGAMEGSR